MVQISARMVSDGGGSYRGSASDVIEKLEDAIAKLKLIDEEQLKAMVKIDNDLSSTSVMMNAIKKRIEELETAKSRFESDSSKIQSVRNRFGI